MPKRDPLAAAIAQATLAMPVAQAPVVDEESPLHLQLLDAIYSDPADEDGPALTWLDALLLLLSGEGWEALSDENHQGLIEALEHTCSTSIPGHPMPCISGAVPGAWGTVSGAVAARAVQRLAIAVETGHTDARSVDIGRLWQQLQRYEATPQAMRWAMRAHQQHLEQAQAEVNSWPPARRAAAAERLEDLQR